MNSVQMIYDNDSGNEAVKKLSSEKHFLCSFAFPRPVDVFHHVVFIFFMFFRLLRTVVVKCADDAYYRF